MQTALVCNCQSVVFYDSDKTELRCPACGIRWVQQAPPMVDDSGMEAKRLPYLCSAINGDLFTDEGAAKAICEIGRSVQSHNDFKDFGWCPQNYPPTVSFVFADGTGAAIEWPEDWQNVKPEELRKLT